MKIAYFDCFAGISGDMTLGALIDAGADADALRAGLQTLALPEWELQVGRALKNGFDAADVEVVVRGIPAGAAATVHPGRPAHHQRHTHPHGEHGPQGDQSRLRRDHSASHPSAPHGTHYQELVRLIRASQLPDPVKERGLAVFARLAEAEARVHGTTVDEIHFHEVGAVDSIVDILGSVYALHLLGVERVVCSELPTGRGMIRTTHGILPVPAPATAELLRGIPIRQTETEGELTTPTGAALAVTLASEFGPMPAMRVTAVGRGAGKRDFPFPNLLRVFVGEAMPPGRFPATTVTVVEANLDDMSPQLYDHVMERLFAAGALDVTLQPIQMKKNRPAHTLTALCPPERADAIVEVFFAETTTLGVRLSEWRRACLEREWVTVSTPYGDVRVKIGRQNGEVRTAMPEYEDCRRRARERSVPLKDVQAAAIAAWEQLRRSADR
ncbi:MAG: nickel pincer cofactor biosynthesis protein LarC [Armatimonadetes bacterium]|nr:nickel pincer cofactor biosynthesis protein LarC [Armatimonadota bacterium]